MGLTDWSEDLNSMGETFVLVERTVEDIGKGSSRNGVQNEVNEDVRELGDAGAKKKRIIEGGSERICDKEKEVNFRWLVICGVS